MCLVDKTRQNSTCTPCPIVWHEMHWRICGNLHKMVSHDLVKSWSTKMCIFCFRVAVKFGIHHSLISIHIAPIQTTKIFLQPITSQDVLSLDLLSEYRIQHGAIWSLYVTSSYSTWIFCRGVSGFAIDCPCGVWCRGLTTCLLYVGPPFGNRFLNNSWAVGVT